jgi:2-methylisocitrate lyase-like PEP mutase family enzyme
MQVFYPMSGIFAASKALQHVYHTLGEDGSTRNIPEALMAFDQFHNVIGYEEKIALEEKYSKAEGQKLTVRVPGKMRPLVEVGNGAKV